MFLNYGVGENLWVPWAVSWSNQSILKEISPECSLKGLMLKLKLQYFSHQMQRANLLKRPWFWERLRAGRQGDDRWWNDWLASLTQWTWVWVNSRSWWWTGRPCVLWPMGSDKESDTTERLNWTELSIPLCDTPINDNVTTVSQLWQMYHTSVK